MAAAGSLHRSCRLSDAAIEARVGSAASPVAAQSRHATRQSITHSSRRSRPLARCSQPDSSDITPQPWHIGQYYTKKRERRVSPAGEIDKSPDMISEPASWNPTTKLRLAVQVVAAEQGAPESDVMQRVESLVNVVPGLLGSACLKEADLVRLALSGREVAEKLLVLKDVFPRADVASMVARCPQLVAPPLHVLRLSAMQARDLLAAATPDPSAVVAAVPMLAQAEVLGACLGELQRLFGAAHDPLQLLCRNPGLAEGCQSLTHQARGDRDADYLKDVYKGQ